jgi:glycosyltransferase involved in cell wall biosynthesis
MNSRYFFLLADAMIACSEGVRQHIIGQGVSDGRIITIYNGIESKRLEVAGDAAQIKFSLGIAADTPAIACIAHLADKKGQADLIKAVSLLRDKRPDLHCFVVGTGENMDSLRRQAEELGVAQRAVLLGYRTDAVAIMNAMDMIILPSLGKEGLPLVLLEAALLGKPAICSDIPGNNEVVLDAVTGLLFPPGDAAVLAARIDGLLADREQRRWMGNAARERAGREFTIEAMTDRVEGLYRRLLQ